MFTWRDVGRSNSFRGDKRCEAGQQFEFYDRVIPDEVSAERLHGVLLGSIIVRIRELVSFKGIAAVLFYEVPQAPCQTSFFRLGW